MAESMTKQTDLAYLAGIIDGEGCIGLYYTKRKHPRYSHWTPRITVVNTDKRLHIWISKTFNSSFKIRIRNGNWKDCYCSEFTTSFIKRMLPRLIPYFTIKIEQAELILKAISIIENNKKNPRWYPALFAKNNEMVRQVSDRIHDLNRRGRDAGL